MATQEMQKNEGINGVSSPYLFVTSEEVRGLITPEMREWLQNATIVHLAPPWLPIPHDKRNYGGIENVMDAHIAALAEAGVGSSDSYWSPRK